MKQKFSTKWIGSKQPRKQRKYRANAPLHIRHKMLSSNLNKELRKKYSRKSFPIKKGDSVKIMRGEFRKKKGKIETVDMKKLRVSIEGINRTKKDGTKVNVYFNPSNLQVTELNLEDKRRRDILNRKPESKEKKEPENKENKKETKSKKSQEKEDASKKK